MCHKIESSISRPTVADPGSNTRGSGKNLETKFIHNRHVFRVGELSIHTLCALTSLNCASIQTFYMATILQSYMLLKLFFFPASKSKRVMFITVFNVKKITHQRKIRIFFYTILQPRFKVRGFVSLVPLLVLKFNYVVVYFHL